MLYITNFLSINEILDYTQTQKNVIFTIIIALL